MMPKNVSEGMVFGRLTVVGQTEKPPHRKLSSKYWTCRCVCGNETVVPTASLTRKKGNVVSCGCAREAAWEKVKKHGMSSSSEYDAWVSMKYRCDPENAGAFPNYAGRGISVCDKWKHSFEAFIADMGSRPHGHSLDRINVNAGYFPENCRWATREKQNNNTRRTKIVSYYGEDVPLGELLGRLGVPYGTVAARVRIGWPVEEAISRPIGSYKKASK